MNMRLTIRQFILDMDKPFYTADLFARLLKEKNIKDRELILQVLDELYDDGLIGYTKIIGKVSEPSESVSWAFYVCPA